MHYKCRNNLDSQNDMCYKGNKTCQMRKVPRKVKFLFEYSICTWASWVALAVKNLPPSAGDIGDTGSIFGLGRYPGRGNGNPL